MGDIYLMYNSIVLYIMVYGKKIKQKEVADVKGIRIYGKERWYLFE